ncbi:MAG: ATP-binding protein [Gammaproteobacteria bacterium]|nr:ATP-binding protein [Gammaproteobacteria bacterium]
MQPDVFNIVYSETYNECELNVKIFNTSEILKIISMGETSRVQFKRELAPGQAGDIVAEIVAMSNVEGGKILIGIEDKTGAVIGLGFDELEKASNYLFNWTANNIKPAVAIFTETVNIDINLFREFYQKKYEEQSY